MPNENIATPQSFSPTLIIETPKSRYTGSAIRDNDLKFNSGKIKAINNNQTTLLDSTK